MKTKLKKGDNVIVMTGKCKGEQGKVTFIDRKKGRVLVDGINMITKHQKPNAMGQGGLIEKEAPLHISNVMYSHEGKPVRLGVDIQDGQKVRVAIVNGERKAIK
ncbi:MAG: 50S ribosomal protein L24 [Epulopiscium sp. Nele67-Bin005]|nr:MAG: 50S ribosomal protein L24 [Epulopiscium sp. Nele67-Bin005]